MFCNLLALKLKKIEKLREETKEKYSGILGKKYAIIFYEITEKELVVTEFFRAVLIDPEFYIHNLYFKHGIMAAAVDEFTLNENWKSKAERETDEGLFCRLVEFTHMFWGKITNLLPQATPEYFRIMKETIERFNDMKKGN